MNGVIGLVRLDGSPLDAGALQPFGRVLPTREPQDHDVWQSGNTALGQSVRRTRDELASGQQPFGRPRLQQIDGLRITADARLDGRNALIDAILSKDSREEATLRRATDASLILHAYRCWGADCVDHLIGDFMFAIWDAQHHRLFCARDQMGVKPFYYAVAESTLVFSNVLDAVRCHPAVSDDLNDLAVADCLLFGMNQDGDTTLYGDVRRVPAGHVLTCSGRGEVRVRRYWSMPVDEPLFYRRNEEYVEHFNELLDIAISDRLQGQPVSVFMSGGLDSTLLAARSVRLLPARTESVRAHTFVYGQLFNDPERAVSTAAASHIGIPIAFTELDRHPTWLHADAAPTPEPLCSPVDRAPQLEAYAAMAQHSPVALYGEGPDNALHYEWAPYIRFMHRSRRYARLSRDVFHHLTAHRRVPLFGTLPRMLRDRRGNRTAGDDFPAFVRPEIVKRLELQERWKWPPASTLLPHPTRPVGYTTLGNPQWQGLFEAFDMAYTGARLDVRHPFMDLRLLRYMLRLPALPWCRRKYVIRKAAAPLLPAAITNRNKTPLPIVPELEQARRYGLPAIRLTPELERFVTLERGSAIDAATLRLAAISHWSYTRQSFHRSAETDDHYLQAPAQRHGQAALLEAPAASVRHGRRNYPLNQRGSWPAGRER